MDETNIYIYLIENINSGKKYIGQTINYEKRMKEHRYGRNSGKNSIIDRAIKKYGKEKFLFRIIEKTKNQEQADFLEREYIKKYNSLKPNGYNVLVGGRNQQGSWNQKKIYMYNLKGIYEKEFASASEVERWSNSFYIHESVIACCNGKVNRCKDKIFKSYHCEKIEEYKKPPSSRKQKVFQFDLDGKFLNTYDSVQQASRKTNTNRSNISSCITGASKTANNFLWSYNNECAVPSKDNLGIQIEQLNDNKEVINRFVSCAQAERHLNLRKGAYKTIHSVLDKNKKRYGFYWKRKDNPVPSL